MAKVFSEVLLLESSCHDRILHCGRVLPIMGYTDITDTGDLYGVFFASLRLPGGWSLGLDLPDGLSF